MKPNEIRELGTEEIRARLDDAKDEYFRMRFQFATGQLTDHSQLRLGRRDIARIATILGERERAEAAERSEG